MELQAICLCAQWCVACREYRPVFDELAARHPDVQFAWVDIEDEADRLESIDIEDFPTLLIARDGQPVFFGPMRPTGEVLHRALIGARTSPASIELADGESATLQALLAWTAKDARR